MRSGTNTIQPAKKLAFKRVGLFLVVTKVRSLVYKLTPKMWNSLHPVINEHFHNSFMNTISSGKDNLLKNQQDHQRGLLQQDFHRNHPNAPRVPIII